MDVNNFKFFKKVKPDCGSFSLPNSSPDSFCTTKLHTNVRFSKFYTKNFSTNHANFYTKL